MILRLFLLHFTLLHTRRMSAHSKQGNQTDYFLEINHQLLNQFNTLLIKIILLLFSTEIQMSLWLSFL